MDGEKTQASLRSKPRLRQNFAGEIIAQGEDQQNRQPEKAGANEDPREARAVVCVRLASANTRKRFSIERCVSKSCASVGIMTSPLQCRPACARGLFEMSKSDSMGKLDFTVSKKH